MQCFHVEARDIPDAWFQAVDLCYRNGRDYLVGEGSYAEVQKRRELDYVTVHIKYPQAHPLLPDIPPGLGLPNPVPEGMDYVHRYIRYILTDEKEEGEQYTYGERLVGITEDLPETTPFGFMNHSQVDEVVNKFKRGFANNQACMSISKPSDIHLSDPPCLRQIDCRIFPRTEDDGSKSGVIYPDKPKDEELLHFFIYFRSWDLWGGFPANLAALTFLQAEMAQRIGVKPGEFVCSSKGLHLYDMYWPLAAKRLGE